MDAILVVGVAIYLCFRTAILSISRQVEIERERFLNETED